MGAENEIASRAVSATGAAHGEVVAIAGMGECVIVHLAREGRFAGSGMRSLGAVLHERTDAGIVDMLTRLKSAVSGYCYGGVIVI